MNKKAIDVSVLALPDGETFHIDSTDSDVIREEISKWKALQTKDKLEELDVAGAIAGVVMIRMLETDYSKLKAVR